MMSRRFVVGRGVAQHQRHQGWRAGRSAGLGPLFSGQYYLAAVRHLFDASHGLRSEFTAERPWLGRTDEPFDSGDLAIARQPAAAGLWRPLVWRASGAGHRYQRPGQSGPGAFCRGRRIAAASATPPGRGLATLMAGNNRGSWWIPDVDDEVLVAFEHGDVRRPLRGRRVVERQRCPAGNHGRQRQQLQKTVLLAQRREADLR